MKDCTDYTWGEKAAIAAFQEKFFNKKIFTPNKTIVLLITLVALWAFYVLYIPHLLLWAPGIPCCGALVLFLSKRHDMSRYQERVRTSVLWKRAGALRAMNRYSDFMVRYNRRNINAMGFDELREWESLRTMYEKEKQKAELVLALL